MTKQALRNKITSYEEVRDSHLANGRNKSAEMEDRVVKSLKIKLEEIIGGSAK